MWGELLQPVVRAFPVLFDFLRLISLSVNTLCLALDRLIISW